MIFSYDNVNYKILDVLKHDRIDFTLNSAIRHTPCIGFRLNGEGYFKHEDGIMNYGEKSIIFIPDGIHYSQHSDKETVIAVILEVYGYDGKSIDILPDNDEMIELYFNELYEVWQEKKTGYYYSAISIFNNIIGKISKKVIEKNQSDTYKKIEKSVDFINKNYTNPNISINEIAAVSNVSAVYLRKLFKIEFGISPTDYLANLRLDKAKMLLKHGYAIKDVTNLSGFNSYSYFNEFFKKKLGVSPSVYRKNF